MSVSSCSKRRNASGKRVSSVKLRPSVTSVRVNGIGGIPSIVMVPLVPTANGPSMTTERTPASHSGQRPVSAQSGQIAAAVDVSLCSYS